MPLRILLVDDEQPVHEAINLMLNWQTLGYLPPDSAMDGAAALDLMKKQRYDVVMTDICMPNMNGLAFMRELRQMNQQVQILVMTAYDQFSYAQEALRCGARDLFLKPLDRHELEARLKELADELLPASAEEESYSRNTLYTKILDFLDHHFREDIAVQKLAEMLYVNPSYLGQYFKKMSGTTINEYVNRKRIDWIKQHIRKNDVFVQKIITDAGYNNSGYFYRVFQKQEGISFAEYRKALEQPAQDRQRD